MSNSNELSLMIQSLTAHEKGYFKKYARVDAAKKKGKYLLLFEELEKQLKGNNDKKINAILARYTSSDKIYLLNSLLDSLVAYNLNQNPFLYAQQLLLKIQLLSEKALYGLAFKLIGTLKELCYVNYYYSILLQVLDFELRIRMYLEEDQKRTVKEIMSEKEKCLISLSFVDKAKIIDNEVLNIYQKQGIRPVAETQKLMNGFSSQIGEMLAMNEFPVSGKLYLYSASSMINNAEGDIDRSLTALKELIHLCDEHEVLRNLEMPKYISSLNNFILVNIYMGNFELAEENIKKVFVLDSTHSRTRNTIFICKYTSSFELYLKSKRFDDAYKLSKTLKTDLEEYASRVHFSFCIPILFDAFKSCFYLGHFKEALYWINKLLNSGNKIERADYMSISRMCEIIVHYELDHVELTVNFIKTTGNYLGKTLPLFELENVLLEVLKQRTKKTDTFDFNELKTQIGELLKNENNKRVMNYFDIEKWIESKLKKKKMTELFD